MTPEEQTILASNILRRGKLLAPDRFPQPSLEVSEAWGRVLGSFNVPAEIWAEAVDLWASKPGSTRMCIPGDILQAARDVRDRWERDPVRGEMLRKRREAIRQARDAAIERGELKQINTMPSVGGLHWPLDDAQQKALGDGR